jgi:hypothetical protein
MGKVDKIKKKTGTNLKILEMEKRVSKSYFSQSDDSDDARICIEMDVL